MTGHSTDPPRTGPDDPPVDPPHVDTASRGRQVIDERSDRPGLDATLSRAADIILEAAQGYQAGLDDDVRMTDAHFEAEAIAQVKALMLAGWSAPTERTLAVPNGLVLRERQWRVLAAGYNATVVLPGGKTALVLTSFAIHPTTHFAPGSQFREELWAERRAAFEESTADADEGGVRRALSARREQLSDIAGEHVRVPRSFLRYLVELSRALHEHGDSGAANSLDNALAQVADLLADLGVTWHDRGHDQLPDPSPIRAVKPPTEERIRELMTEFQNRYQHLAHPAGSRHLANTTTEETYATSPERIEELEYRLARRAEDCQRVKDELLPFVTTHVLSRDETLDVDPARVRAGYVAQQAAGLLRWYANELTRVKRVGTPGVVHEVDAAFHRLALKERDHAWVESANRKQRIEELEVELSRWRALRDEPLALELDSSDEGVIRRIRERLEEWRRLTAERAACTCGDATSLNTVHSATVPCHVITEEDR